MNLAGSTIFVAGATGMAGISLLEQLLKTDPSLRIRATWHRTQPVVKDARIEYVRADLTQRKDCQRATQGCDYAVLAAANTGGARSALSDPNLQVTDNLVMDALLLEALQTAGVQRTVYISSATVYQEFNGAIGEDQLDLNRDPHSAYFGVGWAKRAAEKLCAFWHRQLGMNILIARSANIFGPYARFDPKRSNFIPALIRKAVDGLDPFEVWGSAEVTRDVLFTSDFAAAIVALLTVEDIVFDTFNLGYGSPVTVADVVDWTLQAAGHHPKHIAYSANQPTTIQHRALDCSKLTRLTGWQPAHDVASGIAATTTWWKTNQHWWTK